MKRVVAVLLTAGMALTSTSCAFLFTQGPPHGHERMTMIVCDESSSAAAGDVIMAVTMIPTMVGAVVYGASAFIGVQRARDCRAARQELATAYQRYMETPEPLRADYSIKAVVIAQGVDTLRVGDSAQLRASAVTETLATVAGRRFLWASSDLGVASVDSAGVVSAVASGTATIKAATGGVAAAKVLVVVP